MLNFRAGRVDIKVVEYEEVLTVSHMVIYRTNSGKPGFHQAETINEAIAYVERLRNAEGVETARIYRLEQVDFSFEPVYKVRVDDADLAGYDQMSTGPSMAGAGAGAMGNAPMTNAPMTNAPSASQGGVDPREPIRIADEPPIADPTGTIPGNPPPLHGPAAPPTGPPINDPIVAGGQMPDSDDDSEARRGLFGR